MPLWTPLGSSLFVSSPTAMGRNRLTTHRFCRYGKVSAHLSPLLPSWELLGSPILYKTCAAGSISDTSAFGSGKGHRDPRAHALNAARETLFPCPPLIKSPTSVLVADAMATFYVATYHRFQVLSMHRAHRAFLACRATPDFSYRIDLLGLCLCIQWILLRQPGRWPYDR